MSANGGGAGGGKVPAILKGGKKGGGGDKTPRRNSLASLTSSSLSSSSSSNSSTTDSDEAGSTASGSGCETKGTMTCAEKPTATDAGDKEEKSPPVDCLSVAALERQLQRCSLAELGRGGGGGGGERATVGVVRAEQQQATATCPDGESGGGGGGKKKNKKKKDKKDKEGKEGEGGANNNDGLGMGLPGKKGLGGGAGGGGGAGAGGAQRPGVNGVGQPAQPCHPGLKRPFELSHANARNNTNHHTSNSDSSPFQHQATRTFHVNSHELGGSLPNGSEGYGIAGSGIYDQEPQMIGIRPGSRHDYSDRGERVDWRAEFQHSYTLANNHWSEAAETREEMRNVMEVLNNKIMMNLPCAWLRRLHECVIEGRPAKVWRRVLAVERVLRKRQAGGGGGGGQVERKELIEGIVQSMLSCLSDQSTGYSPLMSVVCPPRGQPPCFHHGHGYCVLLDLLLSCLSAAAARRALSAELKESRRRVSHLAAIGGEPCILDVLCKWGIRMDVADRYSKTPLDYAVMRQHQLMTQMLHWHGADLNGMQPAQLPMDRSVRGGAGLGGKQLSLWLSQRRTAMQRAMEAWLRRLCQGVFRIAQPVSALHVMRAARDGDEPERGRGREERGRGVERRIRLSVDSHALINQDEGNVVLLFVLPVSFSQLEPAMPAYQPHLVRVRMDGWHGRAAELIAEPPFFSNGVVRGRLSPAFRRHHNGHVYAWPLEENMMSAATSCQEHEVSFTLDPDQLVGGGDHMLLLTQAVSARPLHHKHKNE